MSFECHDFDTQENVVTEQMKASLYFAASLKVLSVQLLCKLRKWKIKTSLFSADSTFAVAVRFIASDPMMTNSDKVYQHLSKFF